MVSELTDLFNSISSFYKGHKELIDVFLVTGAVLLATGLVGYLGLSERFNMNDSNSHKKVRRQVSKEYSRLEY